MRFIRTTNSQIEFIEAGDNGQILNSIGLQLGEVYFQIKNGKVAFYLNDSEKPFDNFIWSTNIPLTIDDEVYETEDEVSEALHSIMNDSFQEQLDQLKEDLAAEEARAQEAETQLDDKIDNETSRAVSAETHLQDEVTALSGTLSSFDERITRNTNDISALTNTVNAEIARSTGKDGEHDALISGLTNSLNNEISRATSAETSLHNEILAETNRAQVAESGITANLNAEISRATTRENAIDDKVDSEIARSEAKDASHDAEISGLTTSLQNEINRAVGAENSLRNDLNAEIANRTSGDTLLQSNIDAEIQNRINAVSGLTERVADDEASTGAALVDLNNKVNALSGENASQNVQISGLNNSINTEISRATGVENALRSDLTNEASARTTADAAQLQRITALEVGKADASNVYTKAESDAKYATKDYISGLTDNFYTKGQTNELLAAKADKVSAVASAIYNSTNKTIDFKNISGTVISSVDARDFIKDGMVDTVTISNNNLVITFNTDAGKEDIVISLASIFDPNNYYTKSEVDALQLVQDNKINAISGDVQTLSGKVDTISGDVITLGGNIQTLSGEVQTISGSAITSGEVESMIDEAVSGKQDTLTAGRAIDITNNVVSFTLPISAGTGENSVVEGSSTKAYSNNCHAEGRGSTAGKSGSNYGYSSHAEGEVTLAEGNMSHSEGNHTQAIGNSSHAEGNYTRAFGASSHAEGDETRTNNDYEHASGKFNDSKKYSTTYGSNGNTIFSIGNGIGDTKRHNTFDIRQNGDIYIANTSQITGTGSGETEGHNFYDVPMIKLQDALGQGGGVTSGQVQTMIDNSLVGYQEELTAGTGIDITNNVISVTGGSQPVDAYTKAESDAKFATITNFNSHSGNTTVHITSAERTSWDAKPNVWCGDETAWSQISGSTVSGTIYLVY